MFQFPASPTVGQQFAATTGVTYEWDGTGWVAISTSGSATELLAPPGVVMPYAGATPFTGWLLCDGKSYATASLPALFGVIGYTYGGSGANFNLPDLRGRVIAGIDNMGGAAAGRLTTSVTSTLGGAGGSETVVLTEATMPAHTHSHNNPTHSHEYADANSVSGTQFAYQGSGPAVIYSLHTQTELSGIGLTISASGSGGGHLNVQPTIALNFIIKT